MAAQNWRVQLRAWYNWIQETKCSSKLDFRWQGKIGGYNWEVWAKLRHLPLLPGTWHLPPATIFAWNCLGLLEHHEIHQFSLCKSARCIALHAGKDASRLAETFPRFATFWYWGCQRCEHIEHLWWELPWRRQGQSRDPPCPTNTVLWRRDIKPSTCGVWALYIPHACAILTPHCREV